MRLLVLTRYSANGASSRVRFLQFLPWLECEGFRCDISPLIDDSRLLSSHVGQGRYGILDIFTLYLRRISILFKVRKYDVVWVEKEALPWFPAWFERWMLRGVPYVLDYDDAIFHNYDLHPSAIVRYFYGTRIDRIMADASSVVGCNGYLGKRAQRAGSRAIEIVPTVIDLERYIPKTEYDDSGGDLLRLVWIGSPSTMKYLELLREPLSVLGDKYEFKIRVIAGSDISIPGVDVEFVHWTLEEEVEYVRECDIGVMPLIDSEWEKGKCGYKLIQYMACGLPVVASAVGVNCEIIREGESGYLAQTNYDWIDKLGSLLADSALRKKMGEAGRDIVEAQYCVQRVAPRLIQILSSAGLGKRL